MIRNIIVSIIALIFIYIFFITAERIAAPNIFSLVAVFMVLLIVWNLARRILRGL
jgi:hypothetical protein